MDGPRSGTAARPTRWIRDEAVPAGWSLLIGLLLLGPALGSGYVLSYDLVAVPRQDLLPAFLGVGSGLPRAVPQDAVVAILDSVIPGPDPGMVLQKALLLAIPLLAGWGTARLLAGTGLPVRLVAATLAVWNPFVAERLVLGHATYLLAYALLPWAIAQAVQVRSGRPGSGIRLVLLLAVAALTPGGGLLVAAIAVPIAVVPVAAVPTAVESGRRWGIGEWIGRTRALLIVAGAVAVNLPWLVPALLHPAVGAATGGASVFGLRSEGPWGPILTALGGGGAWNAEVVPASRGWWSAPAWAVVLVLLALPGWSGLRARLGRAASGWWTAAAIGGLVAAIGSALLPAAWGWLVASVPGAGLLRDGQRLLAPSVLLVAVLVPLGIARLLRRLRDPSARGALWAAAILVPLAVLPDAAWGVGGRLVAVPYPAGWSEVRSELQSAEAAPGDVIVLPWSAFRRFDWNDDRTVLDPAPRWLPRTSIAADSLAVATPSGITEVPGDDPRAAVVTAALAPGDGGQSLASVARALGAAWILVEEGQRPAVPPGALEGWELALRAGDLSLWRLPDPGPAPPAPAGLATVVVVDLAVATLLLGLAGTLVGRRVVRGRARRVDGRHAGPGETGPGGGDPLVR